MPKRGPCLYVSPTSSIDDEGRPICVECTKRLRAQFEGYGYNGNGHFCSMRCAAAWADLKVQGIC